MSTTIEMQQFTVGSHIGCDLRMTHPSINRAHAKIYFTDDTVLIEDLDSRAGTFVFHEGSFKRIKSAKIKFNTVIRLGSDLEAVEVSEIIASYQDQKAKQKKDIYQRVKHMSFKRCIDCGSVLEKKKIYCDCCGAIFEEAA
ncbi:MAG: hypothetical protein CME62_17890 [Halobacteriovoraceae bacterium]|nr:hypothetical protein [Halobacteriovoraceae bacterium]|tara:strand:- start:21833 stop:22255 length:423 start_codon:yes stop_codon:yes gene_type:complete